MKIFTTLLIALILNVTVFAQVPKKVIVEHFTNTVCSICASKNPQLNNNLLNNPNVLRISYHPSSPYSSCLLSQYNVSENDARTNEYNIYGATPRIVIQGDVQSPSVNFSNSTIFDNYKGNLTYLKLSVTLDSISISDSIQLKVVTHLVSPIPAGVNSHSLYVGLAEDTVFYNSPNGESTHKNVFRKALNGGSGSIINIPNVVDDSIVNEYTVAKDSEWNLSRVFGYAIIQDPADNDVKQVASSSSIFNNTFSSIEQKENQKFDLTLAQFDNNLILNSEGFEGENNYKIFNINGELILSGVHLNGYTLIPVSELSSALYVLKLEGEKGLVSKKFLKIN